MHWGKYFDIGGRVYHFEKSLSCQHLTISLFEIQKFFCEMRSFLCTENVTEFANEQQEKVQK